MEEAPEDRVDELVAGYLDAMERGEAPEVEPFVLKHPGLETLLRARLKSLGSMDDCFRRLREVPAPEEAPPPKIEGYRILEKLGRGGMGTVFLAEQEALKRLVALKVLSPFGASDARSVERFRREAETIARLSHPGIVAIHDFGAENGVLFLTIDFVPGTDLAGVIARLRESDGPPSGAKIQDVLKRRVESDVALGAKHGVRVALPQEGADRTGRTYPEVCAAIVKDTAEALNFIHSQGILHRDVKPSNVILDRNGAPRLIDFGLTLSETASELTRPTDFVGSAPYCSPEQVTGDAPLSAASEVFSLGSMLYEMLSLRRPFDGRTLSEILSSVARANPKPLGEAAPGTPRELQDICRVAMAKEPRRRYASAGAMADDLRRYLNGLDVRARPRMLSSRAARAAATASALIALGFLGIRLSPRVEPAPPVALVAAPKAVPALERRPSAPPVPEPESRFKAAIAAARVKLESNDPEAAMAYARTAIELEPEQPEGYKALGQALFQVKRFPEAALAFSRTVELSPTQLDSRLAYAAALTMAGEPEAAERQYMLCATQAPKNTAAVQGYGAALARKGDLSGAVREYKKSLDLSSSDVRTHLLIGELLSTLQRNDEAVYYFTKAESLASSEEDRSAAKEGLARLKQH